MISTHTTDIFLLFAELNNMLNVECSLFRIGLINGGSDNKIVPFVNIDYGINLMLSAVSMLYSVINIKMSVVRVEIFATLPDEIINGKAYSHRLGAILFSTLCP